MLCATKKGLPLWELETMTSLDFRYMRKSNFSLEVSTRYENILNDHLQYTKTWILRSMQSCIACIKILNEVQLGDQATNEQKSSWYVRQVEPSSPMEKNSNLQGETHEQLQYPIIARWLSNLHEAKYNSNEHESVICLLGGLNEYSCRNSECHATDDVQRGLVSVCVCLK